MMERSLSVSILFVWKSEGEHIEDAKENMGEYA